MGNQAKTTACKHCGNQIAVSAKNCPQCGGKNKKPLYKRPWFIVVVVFVVFGAIGGAFNGDGETSPANSSVSAPKESATSSTTESKGPESKAPESQAPVITYTAYEVSELMSDLESNALKASDKYNDQYVELTGKLNVIDSSGKYISITPSDEEYAFIGVQCYIKNDDQKKAVMDMAVGDILVVKGQISDVGEVMGYSLNIEEISIK